MEGRKGEKIQMVVLLTIKEIRYLMVGLLDDWWVPFEFIQEGAKVGIQ